MNGAGMMSLLGGIMLGMSALVQGAEPPLQPDWVDVATLAGTYGFSVTEQGTNKLILAVSNTTFEGTAGSRAIKTQGTLVYLNGPILKTDKGWLIARTDVESSLLPLAASDLGAMVPRATRVLLDPGHGGEHDGAKVGGVCEKNLALDLVARLRGYLEDAGVVVSVTREGDETVSLDARPALIASTKSDFMVSIHFNQAARTATAGIETFVLTAAGFPSTSDPMEPAQPEKWTEQRGNAHDAQSLLLAYTIHRSLIQATGAVDRGVKRARFAILRGASAPAVLVECGFMSNPEELAKITTPDYRDQLAKTIAEQLILFGK